MATSKLFHRKNDFYPRPPRGGRLEMTLFVLQWLYFYPRPPRGGRQSAGLYRGLLLYISIHALREEGDAQGFNPAVHA